MSKTKKFIKWLLIDNLELDFIITMIIMVAGIVLIYDYGGEYWKPFILIWVIFIGFVYYKIIKVLYK